MQRESPNGADAQRPSGAKQASQAPPVEKHADGGDDRQSWLSGQLRGLPSRVGSTHRWHRRGLAFAAGSLSVLAMAPFHFWPILLLTFPVVVWLLDQPASPNRPLQSAAYDGWWFGFGYFFFVQFFTVVFLVNRCRIFALLNQFLNNF